MANITITAMTFHLAPLGAFGGHFSIAEER
jgi:hypothetical protein